jgi:Protein of unknown function (DUF2934)
MDNMELAIRERAYHLWMAAGSPDGNSDSFWLSAQREILAASLGAIARVTITAPDAPSADVVKKPARKSRTKAMARPTPAKTKRSAA